MEKESRTGSSFVNEVRTSDDLEVSRAIDKKWALAHAVRAIVEITLDLSSQ
jgi:hypothetical protein